MGRKQIISNPRRASLLLDAAQEKKLDQLAKRLGANRSHAMRLLIEAAHVEPPRVTINQLAQTQQA